MGATRTVAAVCAAMSFNLGACGQSRNEPAGTPAAAPGEPRAAANLSVGSIGIYDDSLLAGWADWSWGCTANFAVASPTYSGTDSISVVFQPWGGLYLHSASTVTGMAALQLAVNGGATSNPTLHVAVAQGTTLLPSVSLAPYCAGGKIPAHAFTTCTVPLSALGASNGSLDGIVVQEFDGLSRPAMYVDAIALALSSAQPPPTPPAAPTGLTAAVQSGVVSLGWASVAGASGYDVYRATASTGAFAKLTASPQPGTSYQDAAVVAGSTYYYQVRAVNAAGSSPASQTVSASIPASQPVAVTIAPASAALDACGTQAFTATVTGTSNGAVAWSVSEGAAGGTIDASGNYTAPAAGGTYHVVAQSEASPSSTAQAAVVVTERVLKVAVSPASATVPPSGQVQLTATVTTSCGAFAATAQ